MLAEDKIQGEVIGMLYILDLLESLIPNFDEWLEIIGFLILFCGIAEAFFGYKLFELVLGIVGFLTGAAIGLLLFLSSENIYNNSDAIRIYVLIGGIIGAALARTFHELGVFLVVGAMGMFILFLITQNETISLVLGVICGVVGVIIEEYVIIVTTALSGGRLAAMGIWFIGLANGKNKNVQLLGWIIGICGIIFQVWIEKIRPIRAMDDRKSVAAGSDDLLHMGVEVVHFLGNLLHYMIENPKETLHKLIFKKDSKEINPVLPMVIGIILAVLFRSLRLGLGVVAVSYAVLALLYIRKHIMEAENIGTDSKVESAKDSLQSGKQGKILFCSMCGSRLLENASFCHMCGEKICREER